MTGYSQFLFSFVKTAMQIITLETVKSFPQIPITSFPYCTFLILLTVSFREDGTEVPSIFLPRNLWMLWTQMYFLPQFCVQHLSFLFPEKSCSSCFLSLVILWNEKQKSCSTECLKWMLYWNVVLKKKGWRN